MRCPKCGFSNRDDARFCKQCGQTLSPPVQGAGGARCSNCGAPLKPGARFCSRCGTPAPVSRPAPPAYRESPPPAYGTPPQPVFPPSYVPQVETSSPPAPRARWLLAALALVMMSCLAFCGVLGFAAAPSLDKTVPTSYEDDPSFPDLTIVVNEAFANEEITNALPDVGVKEAVLDSRPGNLLVTTAKFELLIIELNVEIYARIGVVDGEIQVNVDRIEAGGLDVFDLIGINDVTLGESVTGTLKDELEAELGEGSELIEITTDEDHIILKVKM
ncbi:MAG: zinc-ribbon domain-containing protein [Anaerolineae bacterium]|nr:zinc-ribbon domain-containing protein [Anaerolineae bacterium]